MTRHHVQIIYRKRCIKAAYLLTYLLTYLIEFCGQLQAIGSVLLRWPHIDLIYSFVWSLLALTTSHCSTRLLTTLDGRNLHPWNGDECAVLPMLHPSVGPEATSRSLLALFIPLTILTVCNVCLMRALQQSRRLQSQCRASCRSEVGAGRSGTSGGRAATGSGNSGNQRITPTLVALIVVFTVCVGPSGLLDFFRQHVIHTGAQAYNASAMYFAYQTATVFARTPLHPTKLHRRVWSRSLDVGGDCIPDGDRHHQLSVSGELCRQLRALLCRKCPVPSNGSRRHLSC